MCACLRCQIAAIFAFYLNLIWVFFIRNSTALSRSSDSKTYANDADKRHDFCNNEPKIKNYIHN